MVLENVRGLKTVGCMGIHAVLHMSGIFCGVSGIFTKPIRYRNDGISCFKYRIQVLH